ncbi:MAG: glycosyltransferase [Balneolaceae bacterium]
MNFQAFKEKYEKVPVEHYPHNVDSTPVVSVCVQTYSHETYIKECLEGILKQETDFPFEILLGEDASTDGTREICIEYAKKYPDKIRLFLHHRENNIQIGGQPSGRFNFLYNLYSARGKYIALCEGDDCWTDPLKLQRQVEFMEENEEFSGCFTNYRIVNKKREVLLKIARSNSHPNYYDRLSMLREGVPQTCSVVYRNLPDVFSKVSKVQNVVNGDQVLAAFMAQIR